MKTSETSSYHYRPYLLSVVLNEHVYFVPIMPCVLLVLYCPVCGWKYEEKLRTLLVFAPSTCTALERKTDLVLWETVMCCGLGLVSSESTMGHNANCRGPFFFLLSCEVAFELCWLSWVVAFWSVILFQISYRLFPTLLWSSIWTVLIDLRGHVLISNCVSDFGPFVSYCPVK